MAANRIKGQHLRYVLKHHAYKRTSDYAVEDHGYETPCWAWLKGRSGRYGTMWVGGKLRLAHRVYYEREYGLIPPSLHLDHLCRYPECVRPDHHEPVTHKENARRGSASKLNMQKAAEIRRLYATGEYTTRQLGKRFDVNSSTISQVTRRRSWV